MYKSGLPQGQENKEKSGKTRKNDKSQEFLPNLKNVTFCLFKFTKFLVFESL